MLARLPLVLVLAAVGCGKTPPVQAPAELDDLSAYMFTNFDGNEEEELEANEALAAAAIQLEAFLDGVDLEADIAERASTLGVLQPEQWGTITGPDPSVVPPESQVPIGVYGMSRHDLEANMSLVAEPNHVCIESETTVYYGREYLTDLDCFMDGSCDKVETLNEVRKENPLAKVWFDQYKDYRRVPLEDGREVLVARSWLAEQFFGDGGNTSWDQLYSIDVWIPDADGAETKRYFAMWSSITVSLISDEKYAELVRDGVDQGLRWADNFLDGTDPTTWEDKCKNDRDRAYDRE